LGTFAIFFGFFACGCTLFGFEFVYATKLIYKTLFTGKEWVALGTDVDSHIRLGRAGEERGAARTGDCDLIVLWMDIRFHGKNCTTREQLLGRSGFCAVNSVGDDKDGNDCKK